MLSLSLSLWCCVFTLSHLSLPPLFHTLVYYENTFMYDFQNSTIAYASGDLTLATLQYHLFHSMPIDLCGQWLYTDRYNYNSCPGDGAYHFDFFYKLPRQQDLTTWFSTGWMGKAQIDIHSGPSNSTSIVGSCLMHFDTFTTHDSSDTWKQMPSAMAVTVGLVSIALVLACCICMLGTGCCGMCCNNRVVTDEPPAGNKQPKIVASQADYTNYNREYDTDINGRSTVGRVNRFDRSLLHPQEDPSYVDPPAVRKMRWYHRR